MVQLTEFFGRLLGSLLKAGLSLMKSVPKLLPKSVLAPLGLTAAVSATDAFIQKNSFRTGTSTLIIANR